MFFFSFVEFLEGKWWEWKWGYFVSSVCGSQISNDRVGFEVLMAFLLTLFCALQMKSGL